MSHDQLLDTLTAYKDQLKKNIELQAENELLKSTLRLIAEPERQDKYNPKQLARHALRIEPLSS